MSLTSYQAAPPRAFIMSREMMKSNSKCSAQQRLSQIQELAPAVGFEITDAPLNMNDLRWLTHK
jgi:hypothetical protein